MRFKDFFNYDSVAKDLWREKFQKAKGKFGIEFDTENDEPVAQRTIKVPQDFWDHTDCTFKCEMRMACGDWESPCAYFRCQIVKGYADGVSSYGDPHFCVIPDKSGGNTHLKRSKNLWVAPSSDEKSKPDEKKCWKFLEGYLKDLVQKEIKKVRRTKSL